MPWIGNVIHARSSKHSEKPDIFKSTILKIFEDIPRIELFARQSRDVGWDYWGNETEKLGSSLSTDKTIKRIREKQISHAKYLLGFKKTRGSIVDKANLFG